MRMMVFLGLLAFCCPPLCSAQVTSSLNNGCGVVGDNGMVCDGVGDPEQNDGARKGPRLSITVYNVEPGGIVNGPLRSDDCLIIGIDGGDLLNEKAPFRHVSLAKDEVTLMPKEQPFRLRNTTGTFVKFRMIRIQR